MTRLARVRDSRDHGSALAIALAFLMVFGVLIGVVLQFATTGQRVTGSVRDEATRTYAGGGALDGAINAIRGTGTGVDPGMSNPPPESGCFQMPGGQLGVAGDIDVTCQPRTGSGGDSSTALDSQPGQAVLARSNHASEGVTLGPSSTLTAQGRVLVNSRLTVPGPASSATLRSTGPNMTVQAGNCLFATGNVFPAPGCVPSSAVPGDPGWAAPSEYPAMRQTIPACGAQNRLVTLSPGTYLDGSDLQAALNCNGDVIWFQPGTYYFDFRDGNAGDHELDILNGRTVVGGTPLGWVPNSTLPAGVPVPTAAQPTPSACNVNAQGVEFVFAGDSRLNVLSGGDIQLCAEEPLASTTDQHVVLRGLSSQTSSLPAAAPSTSDTNDSVQLAGSGASWNNWDEGADVDNDYTYTQVGRNNTSRALRVGEFDDDLVPPEATDLSVTVSLRGAMQGGQGTTSVRLGDGGTTLATTPLRTCPAGGCNDTALRTDTVTITDPGLTADIVNDMYVEVLVSRPNVNGTTTGYVDGIEISVDFSAPMRATSGTGLGAPYVSNSGLTTPILRTAGAFPATVVALHGTVDAQLAAVDLGVTDVPYTVIDRGVVVRHLQSAMTLGGSYTGPLISVPDLVQSPRRVLLVARDASLVVLARADVTFGNVASPAVPTTNGPFPIINEWSVN